ncbi:MAG: sugar kinase, partial [Cyanobacteria bacterium P01_A01_bin.135]
MTTPAIPPPRQGLFVGLLTLDVIYHVARLPQPNEKVVALDDLVGAGGPATNAAIAYRHFNHSATLLAALGCHPLAQTLAADLAGQGVTLVDLTPTSVVPPPVSSIFVTLGTGDRAVVSLNAQRQQATPEAAATSGIDLGALLPGIQVVLIDGHQMAVGAAVAQIAQARAIPVVVDGGSWKPGFDRVLQYADYAICAARFRP